MTKSSNIGFGNLTNLRPIITTTTTTTIQLPLLLKFNVKILLKLG